MNRLIQRIALSLLAFGVIAAPAAFAYASVSVSIQSLSPSTNISVGQTLSFSVDASGFNSPSYNVSDSFGAGTVSNSDINSSGNFSWTPQQSDVGTHTLTITVSDSQGDNATTQETITVSAPASVSIQSLSPSSSITSGQTVSFSAVTSGFSNPTYSVSDSFSGSSISNSNINSSGNFSWTPGSNQNGTHTITIYVSDSSGHNGSAQETITVSSPATVVIQSLSPGSNVNAGQTISFTAAASGFNSPSYSVSDSFSNSSISNGDINSSGNFSWTPTQNDVGTHTITVTVSDSSGHTATATETITVGGSGASIQGLSNGTTVVVGEPVTFTVAASGFSSPTFSLSDSFSGSTISNADINSSGYFSWTPTQNDVGQHNLTFYVNDSSGHSGNTTITLTVAEPSITVTSINPGTDVLPNSPLSFTVSQQGFTNPSYTLSDSFSGSTITDSNINSSGDFSWTPTTGQDGSHTITIYATDSSGHSAQTTITVDVSSGVSVQLTTPSPSTTVAPGTAVSFNAYPYGFTSPTLSVEDSFSGSSLTGAALNASGDFYWVPKASDAGTHTITVTATDAYGHSATAQTTITVSGTSTGNSGQLASLEEELDQLEAEIQQQGGGTTASASSGFTFQNNLSVGMTSTDVTQLQTLLSKEGFFNGPISGYYGPLTETAVEQFQAAHGIEQLGIVGPQTRAALNAVETGSTSTTSTSSSGTVGDGYVFQNLISYGQTSTDVTELQKRLEALGYFSGPVTGYFGSLTQTAVEQFQTAQGIQAVGYVGPATRAALNAD